jgi:predicted enzyme related to lactoylglutathione lyase
MRNWAWHQSQHQVSEQSWSIVKMAENIFAFGMYIRFAPGVAATDQFYETVVELPLVRAVADRAKIFWGGEALVYELVYVKDKVEPLPYEPERAPCIPVFRVHGLGTVLARLKAAGAIVTDIQQHEYGSEVFVRDATGHLLGLRETRSDSSLPQDVEARRRWQRGEAFNPGCRPMPAGWQELGWLLRRVADMQQMERFYSRTLGLRQLASSSGRVLFDLGDNCLLELLPGGTALPAPTDRSLGHNAAVLRVHDVQAIRTAVIAGGGHIVNNVVPGLHWAELMYFADPEGMVFGAEQAFHPGTYAPQKFVLPENLEAERREIERLATLNG